MSEHLPEEELVGRAEHAMGLVAGDVHVLDELAVGHGDAGHRNGDQRTGDCVRCARDDLLDVVPKVHLVDPQGVARLGMRNLLEDLAHDDLGQVDHS